MDLKPWPKGKAAVICMRYDHPDADRSSRVLKKRCFNCQNTLSVRPSSLETPVPRELLCIECAALYAQQSGIRAEMLPMTPTQIVERWVAQPPDFFECPRCFTGSLFILAHSGTPLTVGGEVLAGCRHCGLLGFARQDGLGVEFFIAQDAELLEIHVRAGLDLAKPLNPVLHGAVFAVAGTYIAWWASRIRYRCACGGGRLGLVTDTLRVSVKRGDIVVCDNCAAIAIVDDDLDAHRADDSEIDFYSRSMPEWQLVTDFQRQIRTGAFDDTD